MKKLVVIGFSSVHFSCEGKAYVRDFFGTYLKGLSKYFSGGVTAVLQPTINEAFKTSLKDIGIELIVNSPNRYQQVMLVPKLLRKCKGADVLINLPMSVAIALWWPFLQILSKTITVALEDDFYLWKGALRVSKFPGGDWLYFKTIENAIKKANLVIARGKHLSGIANRMNPNVAESVAISNIKPLIIENKTKKPEGEFHLLFVGSFQPRKNFSQLQATFKSLVDKNPDKKFVLHALGAGPLLEQEKRRSIALSIQKQVIYYGWVEDRKVLESVWLLADALVSPTNGSEGVPRVIDEAIARSVPVIATKVGGNPAEFENGEIYLIDKDCDDQLLLAIETVLFDGEFRKQLLLRGEPRRQMLLNTELSAADQHGQLISSLP